VAIKLLDIDHHITDDENSAFKKTAWDSNKIVECWLPLKTGLLKLFGHLKRDQGHTIWVELS